MTDVKKRQTEYKYKIGEEVHIGNFHAVITGYGMDKKRHKTYNYQCLKCGYDKGEKREEHIRDGIGCSCCRNLLVVKGINDIPTTAPWMIPFFQGGEEEAEKYYVGSHEKVLPICPHCGRVRDHPIEVYRIYKEHGISCVCNDNITIPNKFIFGICEQLEAQNQIDLFKREYKIPKIKECYLYDIYFKKNNKKYLVEMDGGWHFEDNNLSGLTAEEAFEIDMNKAEVAFNNNYELIRVVCKSSQYSYLRQNVINSQLSEVVDLTLINWNEVYEFCSSNLVEKVCEYRRKHEDAFPRKIAKVFHLSVDSVKEYMKRGAEIGWCEYDPASEHQKYWDYINKKKMENPIVVEIIESSEIYKFPSLNQAKNKMHSLGYKFNSQRISEALKERGCYENFYGLKIYRENKEE